MSHRDVCPFRSTPTGLEDVSRYPQLLATLLEDPTWTEEDIKKLAGLNLLRVFAKVEQVRVDAFDFNRTFSLTPSRVYDVKIVRLWGERFN